MILFLAAALAASQPVLAIHDGRLAGKTQADGVQAFWGIPFAQPPVGSLRWKPPQPAEPWAGIRDASRHQPPCAQPALGWNKGIVAIASEDCLYLNVRSPDLHPKHPLPVMFWIHGGGNEGGASEEAASPSIPARGIVLVTSQYRLGVLGFMSHPALSGENAGHASGNYGLMDQQAALRWVNSNIARFGGDPENVTIVGGSAGGHAVGLLLVSRGVRGLFHKAIEQSGTAQFGVPARSLKENEAVGEEIAVRSGAPPHATAAQLRGIPATILMKATEGSIAGVDHAELWNAAVVDGAALTEEPAATLARGEQAHVPLLLGANTREVPFPTIETNPGAFVHAVFGANANKALAVYGLSASGKGVTDERFGDVATQIAGDVFFRCPAVTVAQAQARVKAPVWLYLFGYSSLGGPPVTHSSPGTNALNAPGESSGFDEARLNKNAPPFQAYFVNFAKTGDPNGRGLPRWPRFDLPGRSYIEFTSQGPRSDAGLRDAECALLNTP